MRPVTQTTLLLFVVLGGGTLSAMSWQRPWGLVWTVGPALAAGMACGRITGIVRKATA